MKNSGTKSNSEVQKVNLVSNELISNLVLNGDLSKMNDVMKVQYYNELCHSLNLNPVTRPFQLISFQGKQVLYATKDATEQLRKLNGVSVVDLQQDIKDGLCISKCKVQDASGRFDIATGVTSLTKEETKWESGKPIKTGKIIKMTAEETANSIMKSETKSKRRATLSICGLGMLDESELDTMPKYETSDISKVKTVVTNFKDTVINYLGTLTEKQKLESAYDLAKTRDQYKELSDEDKQAIDKAYLDLIAKFIKPEDVTPFDIPEDEFIFNTMTGLFDVKSVKSNPLDELPEFTALRNCKTLKALGELYLNYTTNENYKMYGQEYKDELEELYNSIRSSWKQEKGK